MPDTPKIYSTLVDLAGFETAGITRAWWDVDPVVKVVLAHLMAQGPTATPGDVQRLQTDVAGFLKVTMAGASSSAWVNVSSWGGVAPTPATGDGDGFGTMTGPPVLAVGYLFNGATRDRLRSASAANLAAKSGLGAAMVGNPGEWAITANGALGAVSSASQAAGAAGVRHVLQGYCLIVTSQAAPAAGSLVINIRDGATGAGTILETHTIQIPAALYAPIVIARAGLNVVGSAATAMTIESAAAYAAVGVSVSAEGYDAS